LDEFGSASNDELVQQDDWSYQIGLNCARTLLSLPWLPTAIVASSDDAAAGVIQSLWEYGWHCPQDVSVVGFDDDPLAEQLCPPLTTVC
jgi:LacI family transcriptional regulator